MKLSVFKINQLGDSIVFLPVLKELIIRIGSKDISLFTTPIAAEIFGPWLPKNTLILPKASFMRIWKHPTDLNRLIQFSIKNHSRSTLLDVDQGFVAHSLARVFGGAVRYSGECSYLDHWKRGSNRQIPLNPNETIAQWSWRIASKLCEEIDGAPFPLLCPAPDLSHLEDESLISENSSEIVIHPGASGEYKRWPIDRFRDLAIQLSNDHSVTWIQPQELDLPLLPRAIKVVQSPSLVELVSLIESTELFIGNNSGPLNIAYALGTPSVSLWGPTSDLWRPTWYSERHLILRREGFSCLPCDRQFAPANFCKNSENLHGCLRAWSVEEVYRKIIDWLSSSEAALKSH